jgi:hypothetical protein
MKRSSGSSFNCGTTSQRFERRPPPVHGAALPSATRSDKDIAFGIERQAAPCIRCAPKPIDAAPVPIDVRQTRRAQHADAAAGGCCRRSWVAL